MIKLRVKGSYVNRGVAYSPGQVIDVSDEEARFLMADAPGCFEPVRNTRRRKRVRKPPQNKMVEAAPEEK